MVANSDSICSRCGDSKPTSEFYKRKSGKPQSWCKLCKKSYDTTQNSRYQQSRMESNEARRTLARNWMFDLLIKSSCVDCGQSNPMVLEFDHLRDKTSDISRMVINGALVVNLKREAEKCEIVCSNCHQIRTHRRGNTIRWQTLMDLMPNGEVLAS